MFWRKATEMLSMFNTFINSTYNIKVVGALSLPSIAKYINENE